MLLRHRIPIILHANIVSAIYLGSRDNVGVFPNSVSLISFNHDGIPFVIEVHLKRRNIRSRLKWEIVRKVLNSLEIMNCSGRKYQFIDY